ncbi:hypothetical protein REPUB_Repub16aG0028700 [Reevesia pubescens]
MIDLGLGYYIVKFDQKGDMVNVLTGGPWKILGHYLTVQRWKPNFKPSTSILGSTTIWIQLPELPIEYFNKEILMRIGSLIGKPLKLDANTSMASRGKFSRICVEVDLAKPLIPKIKIRDLIQHVEYEAIYTVCFHCGVVGHRVEHYPRLTNESVIISTKQGTQVNAKEPTESSKVEGGKLSNDSFDPWMMVQKKQWRGT